MTDKGRIVMAKDNKSNTCEDTQKEPLVRLIATDVDGTIIPEGTHELPEKTQKTIKALIDKGIKIVVASGRSYESIMKLFEKYKDDLIFVSNNGACVTKNGQTSLCCEIDRETVENIIRYVRSVPDSNIMVTTQNCSYTESSNEEFVDWIINGYGIDLHRVDDVINEVNEPVVKIAMFLYDVDARFAANEAKRHFGDSLSIMGAGEHWVDFIRNDVDKGNAVNAIQKQYNISPAKTAAFGDNLNDIGLMLAADYSYSVANGREELKEAAAYVLEDTEDAVIRKMRELGGIVL